MLFTETPLNGAFVVDLEKRGDDRGFFARAFCVEEFKKQGLNPTVVQANISGSTKKGTLRGLHYQTAPMAEVKFIRCIKGSVFDVLVDLRPESPSFKKWYGVELSARNQKAVYIPEGFAHGHQTLEPDSQIMYLVSQVYSPEHERGVRYDDPAFRILWPLEPTVMSPKDKSWPYFKDNAL
jgi:dTDP-4-dehydrorhamnose 3,5-epimerase